MGWQWWVGMTQKVIVMMRSLIVEFTRNVIFLTHITDSPYKSNMILSHNLKSMA